MSLLGLGDIDGRLDRWRRFYASEEPALLIAVAPAWGHSTEIAGIGEPQFVLADFDFTDEDDHHRYLDLAVEGFVARLRRRQGIRDDLIPGLFLYYGQAAYGSFVWERPVIKSGNDTWNTPCIETWSDLDKLRIDEDNFWFRLYMDGLSYLKDRLDGIGFVSGPNDYGPMDLAYALRGNDLYTDFYDAPEFVHQLMDFCARATIWRGDAQREIAGDVAGGTICSILHFWLPSLSGNISVDASALVSPDVFREFEFPYIQRIMDHCGGYAFHIHALSRHLLGQYPQFRNVQMMQIGSDPNCPDPVDELEGILEDVGSIPIRIDASPTQIRDTIDVLRGGRVLVSTTAESPRQAQEIVDFVRANSRV